MSDSFTVAARLQRSETKIKRSRFIGTVRPTATVDEADAFLDAVSREFHDAAHNCFAYRIGLEQDQVVRFSDDGEPSGTAGRPILDALDRFELVDTCVVVTRYFGGIKLGTGGLSRAYRAAALDVLNKAGVETRYRMKRLTFVFHPQLTGIVLRTLSTEVCEIAESVYADICTIRCDIRLSAVDRIKQTLVSSTNGKIEIAEM